MDLPDIRDSLLAQGWTVRTGKGSHAVWYPPNGSRAISIPMNGKSPRGRALVGLRATLRRGGWLDPEVAERQAVPLASSDTDNLETGAQTQTALLAPESASMTTIDESPALHVVEEAWARNSESGRVSDRIKEQLLSDETLRYRCAHPQGAGCTYASGSLMAVAAHMRLHRVPVIPSGPPAGKDPERVAATQERTERAKTVIVKQAQEAITEAIESGQIVKRNGILPFGLGAGAVTEHVRLVAYPSGKIEYECADPGCDYMAGTFATVWAHRSRGARPQATPASATSAAAAPAVAATTPPEPSAGATDASEVTEVTEVRAPASEDRGDPAPIPTVAPPVVLTPAPGANGGPFRETVEYLREQMAQVVDHLRTVAAGEYDALNAARAREDEIDRLRAQVDAVTTHRDALRAELDDLKAKQAGLAEAGNQLEQLKAMLRKLA